MEDTVLEVRHLHKVFPGVHALDDVELAVAEGECHALLGANGAGKSTLIKVLAGVYQPESGDIFIRGTRVKIPDVSASHRLGISVIHQELILVPDMTIAENIFLGRELIHTGISFINRVEMNRQAGLLLKSFGLPLDPQDTIASLSVAQQQMVEICRAMSMDARIIIMDEPTATLSPREVGQLFDYIRALKKRKISVIYVSHRIEELFEIADRISVYRDGKYIRTYTTQATDRNELVSAMVGRKMSDFSRKFVQASGIPLLEAYNLEVAGVLHDINFVLKKGEILGFTGIVGAGRTELAETLFGIRQYTGGAILLDGTEIYIHEPADAIRAGIGLIPENRKQHGLNLIASIADNITIQVLDSFMKFCTINHSRERQIISEHIRQLSIKVSDVQQSVSKLSGGNQQKVVIAKWLASHSRILILDEPTRGIDVGAKAEIYQIMNDLIGHGVSIIMISSELPEVLNMCDRIMVMHAGTITACFDREEATQEKIMHYATGLSVPVDQEEKTL